jgi:hypothetical protein
MVTAASVLPLRTTRLGYNPVANADFDSDAYSQNDETATVDNGLSMLEKYVSKLLANSFKDSSLFWHYAMRHVPSDSLMCTSFEKIPFPSGRKLSFGKPEFLANEALPELPEFRMYGHESFSIGSTDCYCGWIKQTVGDRTQCTIPPTICTDIQMAPDCTYLIDDPKEQIVLDKVIEMWETYGMSNIWYCPEMELSDVWGIVPDENVEDWINPITNANIVIDLGSLLAHPRAGLRIGNINSLGPNASKTIIPSHRIHPLQSNSATNMKSTVAMKKCKNNILNTFDANSLVDEIADDLFPVAQAVSESAPISTCLRFSIEFAKLRMIKIIDSSIRRVTIHIQSQVRTIIPYLMYYRN